MTYLLANIGNPFIPGWNDPGAALRPFVGELILTLTILAVLLTPFFTPRKSNAACGLVALAGVLLALASLFVCSVSDLPGLQFRGMLLSDTVAVFWKALLYLFTAGVILLWSGTTAADMHEGDGPEFFALLLGSTLGMSLMPSTSNLLMIFMALELASFPSYVLAGFRKTDRIGAEAALKYVLFGAATSSVMALGLSYLYGLYGTLQVEDLARTMAANPATPAQAALLVVALLGIVVGIGFKISAVPFHFWCPDVFEGAGVDVAAFLSVASKGAALLLLMRILMLVGEAHGFQTTPATTAIAAFIGTLGAVTATVGNLGALAQTNLKRILAYSSIAHAGYMICALSLIAPGSGGHHPATPAIQAVLIYLAVYLFTNLGSFTVVGLVSRHDRTETVAGYAGLGRRSPVLAVCMTLTLFSFVGLPPMGGFMAKLYIMWVLAQQGTWWWLLVAVIGVNTAISLYYYATIVRAMYLESSDAPAYFPNPIGLGVAALCTAILVLMLVGFSPFFSLTSRYAQLHGVSTDHPAPTPATQPAVALASP